jgi:hypothetical protein
MYFLMKLPLNTTMLALVPNMQVNFIAKICIYLPVQIQDVYCQFPLIFALLWFLLLVRYPYQSILDTEHTV